MEKQVKTPRGMLPVTYGPLRVIEVRKHTFRDDVAQAELRQTVVRHYPGARPNNSNTDSLYEISDFGFTSQDFENERVVWINIPLDKTEQDVKKQLEKFPEATIYRILADNVEQVLSEEQLFAIKSDQFDYSLEQAKCAHVIMLVGDDGMARAVSSNGDILDGAVEQDENGKVVKILDETGLQYASKGFSLSWKEDVDLRISATAPQTAERPAEAVLASGEVDEANTPL